MFWWERENVAIDPAIKRNLFTLNRKVTLLKHELAKKDEELRQKDEQIRLLKIAASQLSVGGIEPNSTAS